MASPTFQNEGNVNSRDVPLSAVAEGGNASSEQYTSFESKYNRRKIPILWALLDAACIIVVGAPIVVLYYTGKPYHRGFYCNDESINKPYKDSTVASYVATLVGFFLPAIVFIVVESLRYRSDKTIGKVNDQVFYVGLIKLNILLIRLSKIFAVFLFGAAVNTLLTDVGKYTIGRLRPHFLSVCKPDASLFNCTTEYITSAVCTGDPVLVKKGRLSFPSGHSSFSAYTMVFLIIYIQARLKISRSLLLKPFLQLIPLILASLCGLSRVSDYKHHSSDVLTGLLLGTIVAFVVVCFNLRWFKSIDEMPNKCPRKCVKDCV